MELYRKCLNLTTLTVGRQSGMLLLQFVGNEFAYIRRKKKLAKVVDIKKGFDKKNFKNNKKKFFSFFILFLC